jgi:hypothetical protein
MNREWNMRHLRIVVGLVVMAGTMAIAASPAMANPRWGFCNKVGAGGHWTTSKCTSSGSGEWETAEVASTQEVTSSGELELEDSKEEVAIKCKVTSNGTINKEGIGWVTTITASECSFVKHGECESSKPVTATAVNLHWSLVTELVTPPLSKISYTRRREISLASKGEPGWKVECTVGPLKVADTCEGDNTALLRSNRTAGTVEEEFESESAEEPGTCSLGGTKTGFVRGTLTTSSSHFSFWTIPY